MIMQVPQGHSAPTALVVDLNSGYGAGFCS